jgi:L-asparagine transporter-like permease
VKRRAARPVVITDAERSQEDQLRTRQNRYIVMMSLRAACLIAAVILVSVQPPLVWLWVALCAAGMILLPWIAVVLANDRLPKERHRWRRPGTRGARALPAAGSDDRPPGRTIDADQPQLPR